MRSDKIRLEGMSFYGYHGVSPEERSLGQRFSVDLEVGTDLQHAGASDDIEDTVNYTHLYHEVKEVMEGPPCNLLEALAYRISKRVLGRFPVTSVLVRVSKPSPPIKEATLGSASVEISRFQGA